MIYQGSKSRVAAKIFEVFAQYKDVNDSSVHFYDLFGGGGSMSLYALKHTRWQVHYNELRESTFNAFLQEIYGNWEYRWVSSEDFKNDNMTDLERIIWSFGNTEKSYIYGKHIEEFKRAVWACCFGMESAGFESVEEVHLALSSRVFKTKEGEEYTIAFDFDRISELLENPNTRNRFLLKNCKSGQFLQSLESLQRLQSLESLQRLQRLDDDQLIRIDVLNYDYRDFGDNFKPNSIIYCDPPYRNTAGYGVKFDFDKFDKWVAKQSQPLFVSEYSEISGLTKIAEFKRRGFKSNAGVKTPNEKLFTNQKVRTLF